MALEFAGDRSLLLDMPESSARSPEGLAARFYLRPVKDESKSREAGRPIYREEEYVDIAAPGDKTLVVSRRATEEDKLRFRRQYERFQAGAREQVTGTPLQEWPGCPESTRLELAHFGVRTVEELAGMSDASLQQVGPLRALRTKAEAWLEAARGNAPLEKMAAALTEKDQKLAALQAQMDELKKQMASMASEKGRGK